MTLDDIISMHDEAVKTWRDASDEHSKAVKNLKITEYNISFAFRDLDAASRAMKLALDRVMEANRLALSLKNKEN
jgi:hypothetical protein